MSASTKVIFRIGNKPLRFKGVLLGESSICDEDDTGCYTRVRLFKSEGGSLIWAWDLSESDEPTDEELMRADALVVDVNAIYSFSGPEDLNGDVARRSATPSELAHMAWEKRPRENARLVEASTRAFHEAAKVDDSVAAALYEEVQ
ncbi:MAG TPA: hypothetical protein VKM94_20760 [Blastocatellia bacterium]|nr:hypothetical protein [Blastocatellia bacterium]